MAQTPSYDPRFDRAQSVAGAQARYADADLPDYTLADLESDLDRLLAGDDYPDATPKEDATRELFIKRP